MSSFDFSKLNAILAVLVIALLVIAGKLLPVRWEQREREAKRAAQSEADNRSRASMRVAEIRTKMRNMPPGGELEILAADLREAVEQLNRVGASR